MNVTAFIDGRIAALESDLVGIGARLDELRRVRASLADDEPGHLTPQAVEPEAVPEPKKPKPKRTSAQQPHPGHRGASEVTADHARRVAEVLIDGPVKFHELAKMVTLQGRDLAAALNHDGWFAKDDDAGWELTPKGLAATKGGAA